MCVYNLRGIRGNVHVGFNHISATLSLAPVKCIQSIFLGTPKERSLTETIPLINKYIHTRHTSVMCNTSSVNSHSSLVLCRGSY